MARPSYTEPSDFDRALLLELQALKDSGWGRFSHIGASRSLSESFREEALSELDRMQVPLFSLEGGHLGQAQLKRLATELYTKDAVELIQQYIMGLIAPWDHLTRDYVLNLARFQLAQVYWSSALLGHALRDAEQRFQLERSAGEAAGKSLSDYVTSLGPEEALLLSSSLSLEAQKAIETQITRLFGEPHELWERLQGTVGSQDLERLRCAITEGKVDSAPVTVSQLRHLALEGLALGFLLGGLEADAPDLTSPGERVMVLGAHSWGFLGGVKG